MGKQYVKCLNDDLIGMTKGEIYEIKDGVIRDNGIFFIENDYGNEDYWWLAEEDFKLLDKPKQSRRKCRPLTDEEKKYILDRPSDSSRSLAKQLWNESKRKSTINDFRKSVKECDETEYLMRSENNKERLMESIEELVENSISDPRPSISNDEVKAKMQGILSAKADEVVNTNQKVTEQMRPKYTLNGKGECVDSVTGKVAVDEEDINQRILLISDLHIPYHHKDALEFLQYLKDKYRPTRVICMGDELDKHALSFHDSDPDLPSAGDELRQSLPVIAELHEMFPEMDILDSNHGSLVYRKSKHHGIPRHYIKSYREVLEVDDGWTWYHDMTLDLPNDKKVYLCHGKVSDVTKLSQQTGMCAIQGHYHNAYKVEYWGNSFQLYWAMQVGCLIDDKSLAFAYNKLTVKRPVIGTGLIIDGQPILEPLIMDDDGRWVGRKK